MYGTANRRNIFYAARRINKLAPIIVRKPFMKVYLIRHTAVRVNQICYGASDVELAETAEADIARVKQKLESIVTSSEARGMQFFTSPLQRCYRLASTLSSHITSDARLAELNFGAWEMQPWNSIPRDAVDYWLADFVHLPPGKNGEPFQNLMNRVLEFWNSIPREQPGPYVIVTHGGVIRALICHLLEIPLKNAFQLEIDFGSITAVYARHDKFQVKFLNH